jgi:hypothetical protein
MGENDEDSFRGDEGIWVEICEDGRVRIFVVGEGLQTRTRA